MVSNTEAHLTAPNRKILREALAAAEAELDTANRRRFNACLAQLPAAKASRVVLGDCVEIGLASDMDEVQQAQMTAALMGLTPWRKGPFSLFGVQIDTEWRSDLKWNRILPALPSLRGLRVLDVGCGSGYHLFRMAEQAPAWVLGVDSTALFYAQFQAIQRYADVPTLSYAPLRIEVLVGMQACFDVIFCMGVIYHSRQPMALLAQLRQMLKPGGTLVMETLVMDQPGPWAFCPYPTYAKMSNVHFIPTRECLMQWLQQAKFTDLQEVFCEPTTLVEQRYTSWMGPVQSLDQFLDPVGLSRTVEGFQAPIRAAVVAR